MTVAENIIIKEIIKVKHKFDGCHGYLLLTVAAPPEGVVGDYEIRVGVRGAKSDDEQEFLVEEAKILQLKIQKRLKEEGKLSQSTDLQLEKAKYCVANLAERIG